jgi:hypothetical protein
MSGPMSRPGGGAPVAIATGPAFLYSAAARGCGSPFPGRERTLHTVGAGRSMARNLCHNPPGSCRDGRVTSRPERAGFSITFGTDSR